MEVISGGQHPRVRYLKRLSSRKFRDQEGKFVIEGVRFLEEALDAAWPLDAVLFSPRLELTERGHRLLNRLDLLGLPLLQVTDGLMRELADTETPQGVLAMARCREDPRLMVPEPTRANLALLVDGLQDPGNLGTIIRTADAAGAGSMVLLKGTVDLYNPKVLRATMGSLFHLPVLRAADRKGVISTFKAAGYALAVGDPAGDKDPGGVDFTGPTLLVIGSEAKGAGPDLVQQARWRVRIPMPGRAESLNAAVAAGILMYEALRQRAT